MRFSIFTLLLILIVFLSNGYTQDSATWGLPNGAKIRLGKGKISAVEFSPDGSQIAVASSVGIWLYDAHTGQELALLPGHREGFSTSVFSGAGGTLTVNTLAFSTDGKLLASASEDGTLRLFDVTTYSEHRTLFENKEVFVNPQKRIIALAFSADGKTLTSLDSTVECKIKVWDVNSGRLLSNILGRKEVPLIADVQSRLTLMGAADLAEYEHDVSLKTLALSPDGTTFAATKSQIMIVDGVPGAAIRLGDVRIGDLRPTRINTKIDPPFLEPKKLQSTYNPIKKLVFSPDGTILAGVQTKRLTTRQPGRTKTLVITKRSEIQLWDVNTGNKLSTVVPEQVEDQWRKSFVAFSPDGKTFATANADVAAVQLWLVSTGDLISTFTIAPPKLAPPWYRRGAIDLTFSPDGKTLAVATAGAHSSLQLWEVGTGAIISTLAEHPILTDLRVNDQSFISLSTSSVLLRDINTGEILQNLTKTWTNLIEHIREIEGIEAFLISPDATTVATGSQDGSLQLWNMHTGDQISTLTGHTGSINALAFTADGTGLASSSRDKSIRLWDVSTGAELLALTEHINSGKKFKYAEDTMLPSAEFVNNLVFSPDGSTLASASELGTIWLWELNTGNLLTTLIAHEAAVDQLDVGIIGLVKVGLAFSAGSTRLASGGVDGAVMLSEVSTKPNSFILKGHHTWRVKALVFSPNGKHLVSGSRDNSIRLWNIEIGTEHAVLNGHVGEVDALAFSADGTTLVSGSIDGTILLWDWQKIVRPTDR